MHSDIHRALFYPLRNGDIALPDSGRILLVNVDPGTDATLFPPDRTTVWNWWAGRPGTASLGDTTGFAMIFLALPQQRDHALGLISDLSQKLTADGVLVIAAANDSGGRRLVPDLAPCCTGLQEAAKHKSRIVWIEKHDIKNIPEFWSEAARLQVNPDTGLWTQPGIFSWDRIDQASLMLLDHLPRQQNGALVDAGCGNGVLTSALIRNNPQAERVIGIDADARALDACARNIAALGKAVPVDLRWADFTAGTEADIADWVVMNPPFHQGKFEAITLGQEFIRRAQALLKPRGKLLMVANAHLPYENALRSQFESVEKIAEGKGFKIILSQKAPKVVKR